MPENYNYKLDQAQVVFDNTDQYAGKATILASGAMLHQALEAAYQLDAEQMGVCVVNPSVINLPDVNTIRTCLRNTAGQLVTVEDHQLTGGMGAIIAHKLMLSDVSFKLKSLAVQGEFGQSAYNAIDLYKKHGLDAATIVKTIKSLKA